jgi:hypothetical protein
MDDVTPRLELQSAGLRTVVEITSREFDDLVSSRQVLADALDFEQRYEVLLTSYLDFEVGATRMSLEAIAGLDYQTYTQAARSLLEANRLLLNLMTAARAYLDQVGRDFRNTPEADTFRTYIEERTSTEYDKAFEYRFMEALRNHAQHRGLPAHGYTAAGEIHDALSFQCMKHELVKAGGFKTKILAEMPNQVNLREAAKRYVEGISNVHVALRTCLTHRIGEARADIEAAIQRYRDASGGNTLGLCARRILNGIETSVGLMVEWDDFRVHLARKNRYALRMDKRKHRPTQAAAE